MDIHRRNLSASGVRSSTASRVETSGYVSPTYKSNIFGQSSASNDSSPIKRGLSPTFQSSIFGQGNLSQRDQKEDNRIAAKKANYVARENGVLPTVLEYNPKRSDINNPDIGPKIDAESLAATQKKIQQSVVDYLHKKTHKNQQFQQNLAHMEQKHESRLNHKKPTETDKQDYQNAASEHWGLIQEHLKKVSATKADVNKTLQSQMDHRARAKQNEIDNQRNDLRTGLELKPRKEYNYNEYKSTLQVQLNEKEQKRSAHQQARQDEQNQRLREIQAQEEAFSAFRSFNKSQSSAMLNQDGGYVQTEGETVKRSAPRSAYGYRTQKSDKGSVKDIFVETVNLGKDATPTRLQSATNQGRNPLVKNDWEGVIADMVKKNAEKQALRDDLHNHMTINKNARDNHYQSEKEAAKNSTGLNLKAYKPKESIHEVTEVIKQQLNQKDNVKRAEVNNKRDEIAQRKNHLRAYEEEVCKEFEKNHNKKTQLFTIYKKDLINNAVIKKNQGLMTVKITGGQPA